MANAAGAVWENTPQGLRLELHLWTAEIVFCQRGRQFTCNDTNTLLKSLKNSQNLIKNVRAVSSGAEPFLELV